MIEGDLESSDTQSETNKAVETQHGAQLLENRQDAQDENEDDANVDGVSPEARISNPNKRNLVDHITHEHNYIL